jgi:hypothetical protein
LLLLGLGLWLIRVIASLHVGMRLLHLSAGTMVVLKSVKSR